MGTTDAPLRKGATFIERFEIIEPLGTGLLGAVYRARDLTDSSDTDGNVALKLLRPGEKATAIKDEAGVLQRLREVEDELNDGFHAAPKYIIGSADDTQPYIALEFMRGKQVITLLRENEKGEPNAEGKLPEPVALDVARQLFRLLRILHENMGKTYIDLKFENLWWDGKMLKVTDWNVLENKTEDGVKRDLFRGSLYLYRMLTGVLPKLRSNMDVGKLDAALAWQDVTEGTQHLLSCALHTAPSRRFTKAEETEKEITRLLGWWHANLDDLFGEANTFVEEANVLSENKSSSHSEEEKLLNLYRDIRHIASIAHQRVPQIDDKRLEFLKSELQDDLSKSIAFFESDNYDKAGTLAEKAYSRAVDPAPIVWWVGLMMFFKERVKDSVKDSNALAELAANAAKKYADATKKDTSENFKAAKSHFDSFVNSLKPPLKKDSELALLRDAIEAQDLIADALNGNGTATDKTLTNVLEVINRSGELNPYLPDNFAETVKELLGVEQRLARDELETIQKKRTEGDTLFKEKKFYEAGQAWLDGLALRPENDVLLEKIREAIKRLLENEDYEQALDLIERLPSLTSYVSDLHALWRTARDEIVKQKLVTAQREMLLAMLKQDVGNINEISDSELLALKGRLEKQRAKLIEMGVSNGDIPEQFEGLIQKLSDEPTRRQREKKFAPTQDLIRAHIKDAPDLNILVEKKDYLDKKIKEVHDLSTFVEQLEIELASLDNEVPALRQWLTEFMKRLKVNEAIQQHQKKIAPIRELIEKHEKSLSNLSDEKLDELLEQLGEYKKEAGDPLGEERELIKKVEGFAKKLGDAKTNLQKRASLDSRARLVEELKIGAFDDAIASGRRHFESLNETEIQNLEIGDPEEKELYKSIKSAAERIAQEKPVELVEQFIEVFGKALRGDGKRFIGESLENEKKEWKAKFKALHEFTANNKVEEAFSEMDRLIESHPTILPRLVEVWRGEWSKAAMDILPLLDWNTDHTQLNKAIRHIWATPEECEQLVAYIKKTKVDWDNALAKLQQEHHDLLWKRLNAIIFKNDTEILNSQRDGNLTIEGFEKLLNEVLNLTNHFETSKSQLRIYDPTTLKTNAERFKSYQVALTIAKELWATAKTESDKDRQRDILVELRKYKFSGWRLPGDFEKVLGLPEEKTPSKYISPSAPTVMSVKVPPISSDAPTPPALKRKEILQQVETERLEKEKQASEIARAQLETIRLDKEKTAPETPQAQTESDGISKEDRELLEKILALARVHPREFRVREYRLKKDLPHLVRRDEFIKAQKSVNDIIAQRDDAADYLRILYGLSEQEAERQSEKLVTQYKLHIELRMQPDEYKKKFMDDWRKAHQLKFDAK